MYRQLVTGNRVLITWFREVKKSRVEKSEVEDGEMGDSEVKAEEDETEESNRFKDCN